MENSGIDFQKNISVLLDRMAHRKNIVEDRSIDNSKEPNRLLKPAKEFLIAYFSDGNKRSPSDLDKDILGGLDVSFIIAYRPMWNSTPFYDELTELVDDGLVLLEKKKDNGWVYWMPKK